MKRMMCLLACLLLASAVLGSLTGCKTTSDNLFVGTWGYTASGNTYTYTFNSDMSFSGALNGTSSGSGTYAIDANAGTVTFTTGGIQSTYVYTFSNYNNTLKLAQSGSSTVVLNRQ